MLSPKVVLDTNVVVSAYLKEDGIERLILNLGLSGHLKLYLSREILVEYEEVLLRPKFKLPQNLVIESLKLIRSRGRLVKPRNLIQVAADPDDNIFLECAETGNVDFLVTGNLRHFPREWKGTKVLNARQMVDELA